METPIVQNETGAAPDSPSPATCVPPETPTTKPAKPLAIQSALGQLDLRTPEEEVEFQECEEIVRTSWRHFARLGDALTRIRDQRLYKNEYPSFELYCRERWGFGRFQALRYISAAQVIKNLEALPGIPLPECEGQARPLAGLPAEWAQEAWLNALSWSPNGVVPERLVKRSVKQVLHAHGPGETVVSADRERKSRSRSRESVRKGFQELLTMLLGSTERPALIEKVQEIQRLLEPILAPKKPRV